MRFCTKQKNTDISSEPGCESVQHNREKMNDFSKMNFVLAELCYALNYVPFVDVCSHELYPKEFLYSRLENFFYEILAKKCWPFQNEREEEVELLKPTKMFDFIHECMGVFLSLGNHSILEIIHQKVANFLEDFLNH